jgi:hypothetical protein
MRALQIVSPLVTLALGIGCGPSNADPAFESVAAVDVVVFGGDCAEERCVKVTAPVVGSQEGQGSCALFGPGDPDSSNPLAESGVLEMTPGEELVWTTAVPEDAPEIERLNPVCEPMIEG